MMGNAEASTCAFIASASGSITQPRQYPYAGKGNAVAASAATAKTVGNLMGIPRARFEPDHPPKVVTCLLRLDLRADETRLRPGDRVAIGIERPRLARPVTAGAGHRARHRIA